MYQQQDRGRRGPKERGPAAALDLPVDDHSEASEAVQQFLKDNDVKTYGGCGDPYLSFTEAAVPPAVMVEIQKVGFDKPSSIQSQCWPPLFAGRDVIGVAKTGSGKTLAFLVPGFQLILQKRPNHVLGPTVLCVAPTRELATQIQNECTKFSRSSGIMSTTVYGGAPKGMQLSDIRRGVHIVIATPGASCRWLAVSVTELSGAQGD